MNSPTREQIEPLSQKLDETEEVYRRLLALENEKQQAILHRDPARVLAALDEERDLVADATRLEEDVLRFRDSIGAGLGDVPASGGEPVTLREIAAALGGPLGPELESRRHRLWQLAADLRRVSQTNYLLLKQCVTLLEEIVRAATGESPACNTYGQRGTTQRSAQPVGAVVDLVAGE